MLPDVRAANCSELLAACSKVSRLYKLFELLNFYQIKRISSIKLKRDTSATREELQLPFNVLTLVGNKLQSDEKDLVCISMSLNVCYHLVNDFITQVLANL